MRDAEGVAMQKWDKVALLDREVGLLDELEVHVKPDVAIFRKILEVFESSNSLCPSLEQLEAAGLQNGQVLVFHWLLLAQYGFTQKIPAVGKFNEIISDRGVGILWDRPDGCRLIDLPPMYWTSRADSFLKVVLRNPPIAEKFARHLAEQGVDTGMAFVQQAMQQVVVAVVAAARRHYLQQTTGQA